MKNIDQILQEIEKDLKQYKQKINEIKKQYEKD